MKLRSLAVNQFKKFTTPTRLQGIDDGLNVVIGPNEMGKSTLLDALRAVLFEKYSSKAKPIRTLKNDRNQAAPVVQLAFELDDGVYRVTKRFIKKPYARLSCPDGRRLEGDTAEDTLRGLLGFYEPRKTGAKPETLGMWNVLWVQQGQSFGALDLPDSARSSLHSALESEVGTVLGGRRGRALPTAIENQLGRLITPKTSRPRGAYKAVIDRVDALHKQLSDLRVRRVGLTQTLEDLEDAQENLHRLSTDDRDQTDRKELEEARQRHTRLTELEAHITSASTDSELKKRTLEQAEHALVVRKQLKANVKHEESALSNAKLQLTSTRQKVHNGRSKVDELRAEVHRLDAAVANAGEKVSRHRRVLATVERQARLCDLEERCKKAEDAEGLQREAQQAAAAILVTDEAIDDVRKAGQELETIRSRLNAAATLVSFDMTDEGISGIAVDGELLTADRWSIHSVDPVTITIPDRGRITVTPAIKNRDMLIRRRRDATSTLSRALEAAGAKSVSDTEDQYTKRQKLLADAELARQTAELHAPSTADYDAGARSLAAYTKGLRQILNREMNELELQELPTHRDAEAAFRAAQDIFDEAQNALRTKRAALRGPEDSLGALQTEIATLQGRHDITSERLEELQAQLLQSEESYSDDDLQSSIESAQSALLRQQTVVADLLSQRSVDTLPQLRARIGRLEKALHDRRDKRANLRETIAGLKSHVEAAEGTGLDELIEKTSRSLQQATEAKDRHEREVLILHLLLSTLRSSEQSAKKKYMSPVLKRVRPYLQLLFPGSDIHIDENLHIAGVVREAGYEEAFNHLSMGTQEQIAVLVRLAFAEMLVEQGHPATVVLDDALVFSDDRRMQRVFDILNIAARNIQVVLFTCREQLFERLGGKQLSLEPAGTEELTSA